MSTLSPRPPASAPSLHLRVGADSDQEFPQLLLLTVSRLLPQACSRWLGENRCAESVTASATPSGVWDRRQHPHTLVTGTEDQGHRGRPRGVRPASEMRVRGGPCLPGGWSPHSSTKAPPSPLTAGGRPGRDPPWAGRASGPPGTGLLLGVRPRGRGGGQYQDELDLVLVAAHVVQHHVLGDVLAVPQLVHPVVGVGVEHGPAQELCEGLRRAQRHPRGALPSRCQVRGPGPCPLLWGGRVPAQPWPRWDPARCLPSTLGPRGVRWGSRWRVRHPRGCLPP